MYLRESHTNYYSFKGKENKVSVAIPIIYVMYRISNYGTKPTVVIFSQKSKNITAKILEYTPFSPSGKFLAAEKLMSHELSPSLVGGLTNMRSNPDSHWL